MNAASLSFAALLNRLSSANPEQRADFISCPVCRSWWLQTLRALRQADDSVLALGERRLDELVDQLPADMSAFALAHLRLLRALHSPHRQGGATGVQWTSGQITPLEDSILRQLATDLHLPSGLVRDLHAELTQTPQPLAEEHDPQAHEIVIGHGSRPGTAREVLAKERFDGGWWSLGLRPAVRTVSLNILLRRYGRSPVGQRLGCSVPPGNYQTTTVIAAVRLQGPQAPWLFGGPMDGELFLAWLKQGLAPWLQRDDVVVMDNLATHKVAGVRAAIEATGARLEYLPPTRRTSTRLRTCGARSSRCSNAKRRGMCVNWWPGEAKKRRE